jgi:hypothetical protein
VSRPEIVTFSFDGNRLIRANVRDSPILKESDRSVRRPNPRMPRTRPRPFSQEAQGFRSHSQMAIPVPQSDASSRRLSFVGLCSAIHSASACCAERTTESKGIIEKEKEPPWSLSSPWLSHLRCRLVLQRRQFLGQISPRGIGGADERLEGFLRTLERWRRRGGEQSVCSGPLVVRSECWERSLSVTSLIMSQVGRTR